MVKDINTDKEYSIGEVAKILNLPVHTIRFWTQTFNHIEFFTKKGRRYYDNKAIEELKNIKELSHKKGIKIEGIKQMIRYKKIDMDKINEANKIDLCKRLEKSINILDKIIEELEK